MELHINLVYSCCHICPFYSVKCPLSPLQWWEGRSWQQASWGYWRETSLCCETVTNFGYSPVFFNAIFCQTVSFFKDFTVLKHPTLGIFLWVCRWWPTWLSLSNKLKTWIPFLQTGIWPPKCIIFWMTLVYVSIWELVAVKTCVWRCMGELHELIDSVIQ